MEKRAKMELQSILRSGLSRQPAQIAQRAWAGMLDLVYPPFCLVCGAADDHYLCANCVEQICFIQPPYCPKCGFPDESGRCPDCAERDFAFTSARSVGTFDGVLRKAIHALKFGSRIAIADPLADLMALSFPDTRLSGRFDAVVSIPIHRSRMIQRGFNQADELSRRFCDILGLVYEPGVLAKPAETPHQVELPRELRALNLRGAFEVIRPDAVSGRRLLLVDDVFTTGSTLHEAAQTLLASGCAAVYAYTLARSV